MHLIAGDMGSLIVLEKEFKKQTKMKKIKSIKEIQIEQNKWYDYQKSKKCKDTSEMAYWKVVSNCSVL